MKKYTVHLGASVTPQAAPIPELRSSMTENRAGGWVFEVDDETRFRRFLIIGTEQGTYYASGRAMTREALTVLDRLLEDGKGLWAVEEIVRISESGRAPKPEPAILALARCFGSDAELEVRRAASAAVPRVCRTFDHFASFEEARKATGRGRGRLIQRARKSFLERDRDQLAYHLIKYRSRQGWTPRDLFRQARPKPPEHLADLYRYAVKAQLPEHPQVQAVQEIRELTGRGKVERVVELIRQHRLPWEAIPNEYSHLAPVQRALFESMPMTATVRQLGRLTAAGVFEDSEYVKQALARLGDVERLHKARVHPMAIFLAARTYRAGHGDRGKQSWQPVPEIADALDAAFFAAFANVRPSNRITVVGVDCSGSMGPGYRYDRDSPFLSAFAFAYVTLSTEPLAKGIAFDTRPLEFDLGKVQSLAELEQAAHRVYAQLGQGTDVAVPILYAHDYIPGVEAFLCFTDEETWAGRIHPIEAVTRYRERWGVASKICSVAFTFTGYSVRGPIDDAGALAVIGFDAATPGVISDFLEQPLPEIPQLAHA